MAQVRLLALAFPLAAGLGVPGCTHSVPLSQSDAGIGGDAAGDARPDAGGHEDARVPAPDGGTGACAPMDARGHGLCNAFFGYAWDGTSCRGLSGCNCEGSDCDDTFDSLEACDAAYAGCQGAEPCGGDLPTQCGADEYCDYEPDSCGHADEGGTCKARPQGCDDVYEPVCGCDGQTYGNDCSAFTAGVDVLHSGTCEAGPCASPNPEGCAGNGCPEGQRCDFSGDECVPSSCWCGEEGHWVCTEDCGGGVCVPTDDCAPMDARGTGLCRAVLGVAWNGVECVQIGGCDCDGADCDRLYDTVETCEAEFGEC